MQDQEQFNQVLSKLSARNATRGIDIWIPSLTRGVKFKRLSLTQQKQLIKSSIKETILKIDYGKNIYDIIKANIIDEQVDIDKLTTVDLIVIGLTYRCEDIGNDYGFYIDGKLHEVDLNEIVKKARTLDYTEVFEIEKFMSDNIHVQAGVPTIKAEKEINELLYDQFKDIIETEDGMREILSELYIHEAAKYIDTITMIDEDDDPDNPPVSIVFNELSADQRLQALEHVPLSALNKLTTVSDKVQRIERELLHMTIEQEDVMIDINSTFFT